MLPNQVEKAEIKKSPPSMLHDIQSIVWLSHPSISSPGGKILKVFNISIINFGELGIRKLILGRPDGSTG